MTKINITERYSALCTFANRRKSLPHKEAYYIAVLYHGWPEWKQWAYRKMKPETKRCSIYKNRRGTK